MNDTEKLIMVRASARRVAEAIDEFNQDMSNCRSVVRHDIYNKMVKLSSRYSLALNIFRDGMTDKLSRMRKTVN